jgi:hypothetical protein
MLAAADDVLNQWLFFCCKEMLVNDMGRMGTIWFYLKRKF